MLQVRLLFCATQALSSFSFVLRALIIRVLLSKATSMLGLLFGDTLRLALLCSLLFRVGFGFSLSRDFGLFALNCVMSAP